MALKWSKCNVEQFLKAARVWDPCCMNSWAYFISNHYPDSKVHGADMGPTWVLRPQMGPILAPWTLLWGIVSTNASSGYTTSAQTLCDHRKNDFIRIMHFCPHHLEWSVTSVMDLRLTHWGRDKMAAIFQTTSSNAFSWMKVYEFRLRFHWSLFLRVQLTVFQHWNGLAPARRQAIIWSNAGLFIDAYMRHSASMS